MEIGRVVRVIEVKPEPFALPREVPVEPNPQPVEEPVLVPA